MDETGLQLSDCLEDNIKVDSLNDLNVGVCVFTASRNDDQTIRRQERRQDTDVCPLLSEPRVDN